MITLKITKRQQSWRDKAPTITHHIIEAETKEAAFGRYFKDFANRFKYCNDVQTSLDDEEMRTAYSAWIRNPANYAEAGGDMW